MTHPVYLALILLGGAVGTVVRWWLETTYPAPAGAWPWTTFVINVSGSLALGGLLEWLSSGGPDAGWRRGVRLGVGTGVMGGYTTYSTFAVETVRLGAVGQLWLALGYSLGSIVLGIAAAVAGTRLVRRIAGRSR